VPLDIDTALVRRLLDEQFPQLAAMPVRPVETGGHDNRTFRLGDALCVRLPSGAAYAPHVRIEQTWLPFLAPRLPLPVPVPVGRGRPGAGFPYPWSINRWLPGATAAAGTIDDAVRFGRELADFLRALQWIDARGAPAPGDHNFHRGGELRVYDAQTRACLRALRDRVDTVAATAVWEAALTTKWQGPPRWLHGDVAAGNLLVASGCLCGVIDFGQLAAGDPACDTTISWTLLAGAGRDAFRAGLRLDAATWARGRGWALWKALLALQGGGQATAVTARAVAVIDAVIAEHQCG